MSFKNNREKYFKNITVFLLILKRDRERCAQKRPHKNAQWCE
jgi:hypothetical protein